MVCLNDLRRAAEPFDKAECGLRLTISFIWHHIWVDWASDKANVVKVSCIILDTLGQGLRVYCVLIGGAFE